MIKQDRTKCEIKGDKATVMAEIATLIHTIKNDEILTEKELKKCIEDGFMSEDEIEERLINQLDEHGLGELKDLLFEVGILDEEKPKKKSNRLNDLLRKLNEREED